MSTDKQRAVKSYANTIYDMLQVKPRREVKTYYFGDTATHRELGMSIDYIEMVWESIMEGTFDRSHPYVVGKTRYHQGKGTNRYRGAKVHLYDGATKERLFTYGSVKEAARELGMKENAVVNRCHLESKRPKVILRYEGQEL